MHSSQKIPRNVVILALVALASGFGQDLITPILPAYLAALGVGTAGIGLIDGLLQGTTNFFRLVSGVLSDHLKNRKRLVFVGYAISSLARPLLAISAALPPIAALRVLDGIGKGMKDAPRDALVADAAAIGASGRAFGFHRLVDTAGSVLGPIAASALLLALTPSLETYRLIFLLAAAPGAIALVLIAFGVQERTASVSRSGSVRRIPARFWVFVAAMSLAMLLKINDSLFLLRAGDFGIAKVWIPLLFAGFTLVYALASYPIGVWSDRVGKLPLITAGWLLLALVEFGFSADPGISLALVLFAFYGLFFALTEGSARAIIADIVPFESRGTAYAIFSSAVGASVIIGGYGLGRIWEIASPEFAFRVAGAGSLLGAAALFALWRTTQGVSSVQER